VKGVTLGVLAGSAWLGAPREAGAQSALCPSNVVIPAYARIYDRSGNALQTELTDITSSQGYCTNDAGAFSGAALASQALSELSQSTSQETTRTTGNAIVDRREVERQRCAEGFTRVDGICEPIAPIVTEAVAAMPPTRVETLMRARAGKTKNTAVVRSKSQAPLVETVRVAPPPPPPVFIEPEARFGAWTQVIGNYEHRDATGAAGISSRLDPASLTNFAIANVPLTTSVSSRTGTIGFQVGADITARGVLVPGDGVIFGGFGGYVSSHLSLSAFAASSNPTLAPTGTSTTSANLSGATTGLYATYFNGPVSTDFVLKVDALTLNETFTDTLAFAPGLRDFFNPFNIGTSSSGSTSLLNATVAGNLNYRFDLTPNYWIEPTVGAQYTLTSYGVGATALGLADGSLVMVQGGSRFGTRTLIADKVLMTTTLTGLAYSNVLVSGGFIPGVGFAGSNILAKADQGQVRGRGVLAFNFDFGQGVKSFILGEVRGGQGLFGAGGKAGVRLEW
jgi:hypothetical protein